MWDDVIGEPEGIRSPECAWRLSGHCFRLSRSCCYVFLSVLVSPLLALCFGFTFACLAFQVSRRPFSLFSDRSVLPTVLSLSTQYHHYTNIIAMLTIIFVSQPIGNVGRRFTIDFQWKNFFLSVLFCIKISWKFRSFFPSTHLYNTWYINTSMYRSWKLLFFNHNKCTRQSKISLHNSVFNLSVDG